MHITDAFWSFINFRRMGVFMDFERENGCSSAMERLKRYEKAGVKLFLDGVPTNTEHIIEKCVREDTAYMADYITDDVGNVREIRYDEVSHLS